MLPAARAKVARGREPKSIRVGQGEYPAKASPAKETEGFRRRGSDGFVANLFLRFLVRRQLACSYTVENLDSPQHDDDGRYQRGRRQYTF